MSDYEIIAVFMGGIRDNRGAPFYLMPNGIGKLPPHVYGIRELEFDKDWNLLMPVVEKINSVDKTTVSIYPKHCIISVDGVAQSGAHDFNSSESGQAPIDGNLIKIVYLSVLNFVKWYNQHKS